ncbi:MAG: hypothetical protein GC179_06340 [Anaerolineaceae bacterium]|nr:hypothetical protein [Anaerolineaceae bacterium]
MKQKQILLFTFLMLMLLAGNAVHAQEATPEPGTPQENECNPGGALYREENQDGCPTEWYWKAGWYLAAVNNGRISRDDVPDEFTSVLPPPDTSDDSTDPDNIPEPPIGTCWFLANIFGYRYIGPINTLGNLDLYVTGDCPDGDHINGRTLALILAPSEADALDICATLGTVDYVEPFSNQVYLAPEHSYLCYVL